MGRPAVPAVRDDLRAEYERLAALNLGHTRADIKQRIRRAVLARMACPCPVCGAQPWELCRTSRERPASELHAPRKRAAAELVLTLPKMNYGDRPGAS